MAVFTTGRLPIIRADKTREFINNGNRSKATDGFLAECKESAKLFKRKSSNVRNIEHTL